MTPNPQSVCAKRNTWQAVCGLPENHYIHHLELTKNAYAHKFEPSIPVSLNAPAGTEGQGIYPAIWAVAHSGFIQSMPHTEKAARTIIEDHLREKPDDCEWAMVKYIPAPAPAEHQGVQDGPSALPEIVEHFGGHTFTAGPPSVSPEATPKPEEIAAKIQQELIGNVDGTWTKWFEDKCAAILRPFITPASHDEKFEHHTKAVSEFLNELYAILVDPLAEGTMKVAYMCKAIKDAALEAREFAYKHQGCDHGEEYLEVCSNLMECVKRHDLGLGGERCDELVIAELDRLATPATPTESVREIEHLVTFKRNSKNGAGLHAVFVGDMPVHHFHHDKPAKVELYMGRLRAEITKFADERFKEGYKEGLKVVPASPSVPLLDVACDEPWLQKIRGDLETGFTHGIDAATYYTMAVLLLTELNRRASPRPAIEEKN